ncbi:hypothetical protein PHISCL_03118 [Aspergillus sclerotialis]|uniref:Uncharacterized protein n=1 Tax=Aspergillus sclerotialis TaxID=2070753 RepID=A0A3A3A597_9EURO|nr:hypothetical protein PHISCL_03118 [Aspergillus sclerotialis]
MTEFPESAYSVVAWILHCKICLALNRLPHLKGTLRSKLATHALLPYGSVGVGGKRKCSVAEVVWNLPVEQQMTSDQRAQIAIVIEFARTGPQNPYAATTTQ